MAQNYFAALRDVALAVNSSLEPSAVLHQITEHAAKAMSCKACTIRLLDGTGHFLLPTAAYGLSDSYMRKGPVEVGRSGPPKPRGWFPCCPRPCWSTASLSA